MSSLPYIQQLTKVIVAQIAQTIGWNSIQTTPLELITDILHKHLEELTRQTQRYTELYGRTEPNLDDIALAFNDLNINVADLEEYISNVDSVPCIINVPKFPIPKESNLNFLKPGSKEVVTRPVHIHEHLPPIQPHEETPPAEIPSVADTSGEDVHNTTNIIQTYISTNQISDRPLGENGVYDHEMPDIGSETINVIGETTVVENHTTIDDENTFRKPFDVPPAPVAPTQKSNINNNENTSGKPTREIVSCFMTTGGYISPAREGKLPDSRKPMVIQEDPEPEPIVTKQRSASPEVIERKHHSSKRDSKNDSFDSLKNHGNASNTNAIHIDESYEDEDNGKGVKMYEVIQTVPDALPGKKKTKKSLLEMAQTKEQKKPKKSQQLKANRNLSKMSADAAMHPFNFGKSDGLDINILGNDKIKKKMHKIEVKKKHKKLGALPSFGVNNPELQDKRDKKRMSKLTKKNMETLGLNPNTIEAFAIPTATDAYSMHDQSSVPKETPKKMKKLSTEPDKQKTKIFKKLTPTASKENPHEMDRMMTEPNLMMHGMSSTNDVNHQMDYNAMDEFDGHHYRHGHFGLDMIPGMDGIQSCPQFVSPNKKQKLQKKLNKLPKEPKTPKIKKEKKDPLAKKERVPKTPKLETPLAMPKTLPPHQEENPLSRMFLNEEFRPNVGLIDQFPVPGLNPMNPLFQSVQNYSFAPGLPGNFDFANLTRFKRPNFNDPVPNDIEHLSRHSRDITEPSKPLCNVAPLMPPSLLNMDMHQRDEFMTNQSLNEPHSSQKHYQEPSNSSFGSKKNVSFNPAQFGDQTYGDDSPIIINSDDDDDKHRNTSQSPGLEPEFGGEVKRKKVKDKKDKEKKEKKDKETGIVKLKKKKDKKDKSKNKGEHSKMPKDKAALKKEKREKKKERERAGLSTDGNDSMATTSNSFFGMQSHSEWPRDAFSKEPDHHHSHTGDNSDLNSTFNADNTLETSTIPKLTLKLPPNSSSPSSRTSRPSTPDFPINKKSSKKKKNKHRLMEDDSDKSEMDDGIGKADNTSEQIVREPSPELARISALITRPPKQKSNKQVDFSSPSRNDYFDPSTPPIRSDYHSSMASSTPLPATPSGRGRPKGSSSLKSKKSKTSASFSADADSKKSQAFDTPSTVIDPHSVQNVVHVVDEQTNEENQVWICPACGRVDDGTPMIGCDGCDDWYHWVCVGILVPPNEDQDWFCRVCISRKQEDKKKKRKKKDKKDH